MKNNRIRQLRIERGLSLDALAQMIGISAAHLSRVELGQRALKRGSLERLSHVLSVPPSEIEGGAVNLDWTSDVDPYKPAKGSFMEKAMQGTNQKMFKVRSDVLCEAGIAAGDPIAVDMSVTSVNQLEIGDIVIAKMFSEKSKTVATVLRQFIPPALLVSNSIQWNFYPIHIVSQKAEILGRVLR